ncbi:MAG: competence/damage-inducible protein A [Rhodobacterales bacterium]|nr:competence/damage-inducible protein A [Rhodobacterales bacterium]
MPTVAVIVIGEEILSGKFVDENGPFFIKRLSALGADLRRLLVIGDEIDLIAREVAWASAEYDWVITTGGVGPTHDDVTLESIAQALQVPLVEHPALVQLLKDFDINLNSAALRMARVPEGSTLINAGDGRFPVLRAQNVFVLPGVPKLMRKKFVQIENHFIGTPPTTRRLYSAADETQIAAELSAVQSEYPQVAIGSYPRFNEDPWNVIITLESRDSTAVEQAMAALRSVLLLVDGPAPEPKQ